MDLGLNGKVALVAAASRGLGQASALALAREGARITICARTAADLQAAAEEIRRETGAEVLAVPADLTSAEGIKTVVAATVERFGGIDIHEQASYITSAVYQVDGGNIRSNV